jgi:PKD repeat protein
MKKIILLLLLTGALVPGFSQGYVFISGNVTDSLTGSPVPGHVVTILSDSTNGFVYYNVVYTDSTGYYFDDVPVMGDSTGIIFVQTLDCNFNLHQATIIYNPVNNTFTQDFQICTSNVICQAFFTFDQIPGLAFLFTDQSTGIIQSWTWEFGDGAASSDQNPYHSFPGPGTYNTCLTINGYNCSDTYCLEIVISDTVYQQIYGQVFEGNFPLQQGVVEIFALNPDGSFFPLNDGCPVDSNGIYYFTLVPQGTYLLQAIPYDSTGYLPTYYGNVTNWQTAVRVEIGEPVNPYNINLVMVPAGTEYYGPGSLTGQINNIGIQRSQAEKVNILLMDENATAIGFCGVNSSGQFMFPSLGYGTYHLRAELAGINCDILKFEISPDRPDLEVYLNYSGNSILGMEDKDRTELSVSFYPNPASGRLNIVVDLLNDAKLEIRLISMTGQLVYQDLERFNSGRTTKAIRVEALPAGVYFLIISSGNGDVLSRKVVVTR